VHAEDGSEELRLPLYDTAIGQLHLGLSVFENRRKIEEQKKEKKRVPGMTTFPHHDDWQMWIPCLDLLGELRMLLT
jgi:hypothetical protein